MSCTMADPAIFSTYQEILSGNVVWMILGYSGTRDVISFYSKGTNMDEFRRNLNEDVLYGFVRIEGRCAFITYMSEQVSGVRRARALVHGRSISSQLKDYDVHFTATSLDDVSDNSLRHRLKLVHSNNRRSTSSVQETPPLSPVASPELHSSRVSGQSPPMQTANTPVNTMEHSPTLPRSPTAYTEEDSEEEDLETWMEEENQLLEMYPDKRKSKQRYSKDSGASIENSPGPAPQHPPPVPNETIPVRRTDGEEKKRSPTARSENKNKGKALQPPPLAPRPPETLQKDPKSMQTKRSSKTNGWKETNTNAASNAVDINDPDQLCGYISCQVHHASFWKRRWFILSNKRMRLYRDFMDAWRERDPTRVVDLNNIRQVEAAEEEVFMPNSFRVKFDDSSLYFFADSPKGRELVVEYLKKLSVC
ncbi:uncharacterized protein VTP21DRAFT_4358 [Calcarisporiella thermophila]|uniref:uncharacterized protein n=1 Tax=Calcarisporiella thermophila TaxID=911321 RepID=UPI0037432A60